jgi:hypothetical protein
MSRELSEEVSRRMLRATRRYIRRASTDRGRAIVDVAAEIRVDVTAKAVQFTSDPIVQEDILAVTLPVISLAANLERQRQDRIGQRQRRRRPAGRG